MTSKSAAAAIATSSASAASKNASSSKTPGSGGSTSTVKKSATTPKLASIFTQSSSSKREREEGDGTTPDIASRDGKLPKVSTDEPWAFKWIGPSADAAFLLHGTYGPPVYSPKLACFDIDGTLIEPKSLNSKGKQSTFPKNSDDWKFWCEKGSIVKRLQECHDMGYSIVFVSNQKYAPTHKSHQNFKLKLPKVAKALGRIPFIVFAATTDDKHRKPNIGIWMLVEKIFAQQGVVPDKSQSFYVGDAAGRSPKILSGLKALYEARTGRKNSHPTEKDHNNTDLKWAENIGIKFYTPEAFFWEEADKLDFLPTTAATDASLSVTGGSTL